MYLGSTPLVSPLSKTTNDWTLLKEWSVSTISPEFNSRPDPSEFVAVTGLDRFTQQVEVLTKIKTSPTSGYRLYVWVDDGTEIYCVSPAGANARDYQGRYEDPNGVFDVIPPVLVDLKRYTDVLKIAVVLTLEHPNFVFDNTGYCVNVGYRGGEQVALFTTGTLPSGLGGNLVSINPDTDTISTENITLLDGEALRLNLTNSGNFATPPIGLSARGYCSDVDTNDDWFDLETTIPFAVGDSVRFRAAPGSTLPSVSGAVINPGVTYAVVEVSGNKIRVGVDSVSNGSITARGVGIYYVFKFPYTPVFAKGTNQLSYTPGGTAIDFKPVHENKPVTITPGVAATVNHTGHPFVNNQKLFLTATTLPGQSFNNMPVYVKNAGANSYNLSLNPNGLSVAFTSAGTGVVLVDPATNLYHSVTITAGTPGSIVFPTHLLGAGQYFTLGGTTLPTDYNQEQLAVIVNALNSVSFQFSEHFGYPPCTFANAGTSVTLNATWRNVGGVPIERIFAYIAEDPEPTHNKIHFASTPTGDALLTAGGIGNHTIIGVGSLVIKEDSYIKGRAL